MDYIEQNGYLVTKPIRTIERISYRKQEGQVIPYKKTVVKKLSDIVVMVEHWSYTKTPDGDREWMASAAYSHMNKDGKIVVGESRMVKDADDLLERLVRFDDYKYI